jgi:hypothetical protein
MLNFVSGDLTVIKELPSTKGRGTWLCKCTCGNTISVTTSRLKAKSYPTTHCGCKTAVEDLTEKRFNNFIVLKRDFSAKRTSWICKCDCGNIKTVSAQALITGSIKSCGCKVPYRAVDLVNKRIGKLTVISRHVTQSSKDRKWNCLCDCGNSIIATTSQLVKKDTTKTHCGCSGKKLVNNDLTNKTIGNLYVVKETKSDRNKKAWECLCSCGTTIICETSVLQHKQKTCCPKCSAFKTEKYCIEYISTLLNKPFKKVRNYISRYEYIEFDGFNEELKIAIEYQGLQHYVYPSFWHKTVEEFHLQQERDVRKREFCKNNNIKLIEIPYTEEKNIDKYIQKKVIDLTGLQI